MIPLLLRARPDFRRLWVGETISFFGDQISLIAIPLTAVLVLHAHAAEMGYLTAAELAPNLLFSLHLGAWIDRRGRRRRAMVASDLARAALLASIPLAAAVGRLSYAQLLIVGFLAGSFSVLFQVSYPTLLSALVPREGYVEANQLMSGSRALSFVGGPSVGGALVQLFTAPFAVAADAVSLLVSALYLKRISSLEPPTEQAQRGHLTAGARYIRRTPLLLASLASTATINLFNFVFWALFVLYATRALHVRPGTLGLVLGAGAVGGLIGAALTGPIARALGVGPACILGSFLFPAPLVLVPLAQGPRPLILTFLFLAEFGSGFGVMLLDITIGSIRQALVPDRLRARVSGAYMLVNYGVRPLGSLIGGALGASIGLRPTLWIATIAATLGVAFLLPSPALRLRELPATSD